MIVQFFTPLFQKNALDLEIAFVMIYIWLS